MRDQVLAFLRGRGGFRSAGEVARELRLPRARVKTVLDILEAEGVVSSKLMEFQPNGAGRTGKGYAVAGGGGIGRCHFVVDMVKAKNPYVQCGAPATRGELCEEHHEQVERVLGETTS